MGGAVGKRYPLFKRHLIKREKIFRIPLWGYPI